MYEPGFPDSHKKGKSAADIEFMRRSTVRFLFAVMGRGTRELSEMKKGETALLTGPLGNSFLDFMPANPAKPVALVSGGIGIAPLISLADSLSEDSSSLEFHFYAGFRTGFRRPETRLAVISMMGDADKKLIITEDGHEKMKGLVTDALRPEHYAAVFACGPEPMLRAVAQRCAAERTPCFVSLERRMACGVGACLGCTVETRDGNKRCCSDGPIFPAGEVFDAA
jgi:NAD(P)H-flavin reductase